MVVAETIKLKIKEANNNLKIAKQRLKKAKNITVKQRAALIKKIETKENIVNRLKNKLEATKKKGALKRKKTVHMKGGASTDDIPYPSLKYPIMPTPIPFEETQKTTLLRGDDKKFFYTIQFKALIKELGENNKIIAEAQKLIDKNQKKFTQSERPIIDRIIKQNAQVRIDKKEEAINIYKARNDEINLKIKKVIENIHKTRKKKESINAVLDEIATVVEVMKNNNNDVELKIIDENEMKQINQNIEIYSLVKLIETPEEMKERLFNIIEEIAKTGIADLLYSDERDRVVNIGYADIFHIIIRDTEFLAEYLKYNYLNFSKAQFEADNENERINLMDIFLLTIQKMGQEFNDYIKPEENKEFLKNTYLTIVLSDINEKKKKELLNKFGDITPNVDNDKLYEIAFYLSAFDKQRKQKYMMFELKNIFILSGRFTGTLYYYYKKKDTIDPKTVGEELYNLYYSIIIAEDYNGNIPIASIDDYICILEFIISDSPEFLLTKTTLINEKEQFERFIIKVINKIREKMDIDFNMVITDDSEAREMSIDFRKAVMENIGERVAEYDFKDIFQLIYPHPYSINNDNENENEWWIKYIIDKAVIVYLTKRAQVAAKADTTTDIKSKILDHIYNNGNDNVKRYITKKKSAPSPPTRKAPPQQNSQTGGGKRARRPVRKKKVS